MQRHKDEREQQKKSVTLADLARAIEQRRVPFSRKGDDYVVQQTDVRRLGSQHEPVQRDSSLIARRLEMLLETLDMGRSA